MDWRCGSSGRVFALQMQSPVFICHLKKKKKKKKKKNPTFCFPVVKT
jgi:hypothetical protein